VSVNALASERPGSLATAIPTTLNLCLAAAHLLASLYQLFILPLFLLPASSWWLLTLVPLAALNNPFWSLIHEAIHDMFHPSRRVSRTAGRTLGIFFGAPFLVLRLSHLLHHKLNRTPVEATEPYDPAKTSKARAACGYFFQVLGGLYLLEFISPWLFFLFRRTLHAMERKRFSGNDLPGHLMRGLMRDEAITEMRIDGALILVLFALSALSYGAYWPWLVAALLARAFLISFLDNVYHYGTPINDIFYARNLFLSPPLSAGLLYFNLHGIHHKNPSIPWIGLPDAFRKQEAVFEGTYFTAALDQLAGPIPLSELPRAAAASGGPA